MATSRGWKRRSWTRSMGSSSCLFPGFDKSTSLPRRSTLGGRGDADLALRYVRSESLWSKGRSCAPVRSSMRRLRVSARAMAWSVAVMRLLWQGRRVTPRVLTPSSRTAAAIAFQSQYSLLCH